MEKDIRRSQIIMLPGGLSGGDEPDGSGKFIATTFRNPKIKDAVTDLLQNRDGLMLGICNGFQALIKLGLVPYGEIRALSKEAPTLTFNQTNSDWNNIATKNGAKLILKNLNVTNSGRNDGPWNRHDLNFACEVVFFRLDAFAHFVTNKSSYVNFFSNNCNSRSN